MFSCERRAGFGDVIVEHHKRAVTHLLRDQIYQLFKLHERSAESVPVTSVSSPNYDFDRRLAAVSTGAGLGITAEEEDAVAQRDARRQRLLVPTRVAAEGSVGIGLEQRDLVASIPSQLRPIGGGAPMSGTPHLDLPFRERRDLGELPSRKRCFYGIAQALPSGREVVSPFLLREDRLARPFLGDLILPMEDVIHQESVPRFRGALALAWGFPSVGKTKKWAAFDPASFVIASVVRRRVAQRAFEPPARCTARASAVDPPGGCGSLSRRQVVKGFVVTAGDVVC